MNDSPPDKRRFKKPYPQAIATHFECGNCGGSCDGPGGHEICDRFGLNARPCYCDLWRQQDNVTDDEKKEQP